MYAAYRRVVAALCCRMSPPRAEFDLCCLSPPPNPSESFSLPLPFHAFSFPSLLSASFSLPLPLERTAFSFHGTFEQGQNKTLTPLTMLQSLAFMFASRAVTCFHFHHLTCWHLLSFPFNVFVSFHVLACLHSSSSFLLLFPPFPPMTDSTSHRLTCKHPPA